MSQVTCHISISLDGYAAGPDQSLESPLGKGGEFLHTWMFEPAGEADVRARERVLEGVGAFVMGRRMFFGGGRDGDWDPAWRGWWGEDPPYHAPVYVLTHHPREPLEMMGGTTFFFVTDGIESALEQARAAAGDQDVSIAGGASVVQQYLAAGHLDQVDIDISPVLLGGGERLFENVGGVRLEPVEAQGTRAATHITYRVVR